MSPREMRHRGSAQDRHRPQILDVSYYYARQLPGVPGDRLGPPQRSLPDASAPRAASRNAVDLENDNIGETASGLNAHPAWQGDAECGTVSH